MFNDEESCIFVRPDHEWVMTVGRGWAGVLTAEVNKVGAGCVPPEEVIDPVALLVGICVLEIEMVYIVVEPFLLKVTVVNVG